MNPRSALSNSEKTKNPSSTYSFVCKMHTRCSGIQSLQQACCAVLGPDASLVIGAKTYTNTTQAAFCRFSLAVSAATRFCSSANSCGR